MVCCFKKSKLNTSYISKLIIDGRTLTDTNDICNGFNQLPQSVSRLLMNL